MPTHKLIILRHGESQWNHENKFCGWIDIPLSDKGKEEAIRAGELIKKAGLNPDVLYTSRLTRSIDTGLKILNHLDKAWLDHYKVWQLNERHYGQYQGCNKHDIFLKLGQDREKFQYIRRDYHGTPPNIEGPDPCIDDRYNDVINQAVLPKGESLEMVMKRVMPFFIQEVLNHQLIQMDRTVLVVTHGSVVRSVIKHLSHVSDADISSINVPTGVPLVFEIDDHAGLVHNYYYLDKELAAKGIEKVRNEGLSNN